VYIFNSDGFPYNCIICVRSKFYNWRINIFSSNKIISNFQINSSSNSTVYYKIAEKKAKYARNIILLIIIILLAIGNILQTPKPAEYGKVDFGFWRYIWLLPGDLYNYYYDKYIN